MVLSLDTWSSRTCLPSDDFLPIEVALSSNAGPIQSCVAVIPCDTYLSHSVGFRFLLLKDGNEAMTDRFYSNEYMNTNPPYSLCLVQAIFKHGIDPAFLLASFLHVFETWQNASRGPVQQTHSKARQRIILGLPHLNFVVASISTAVMGTRFPEKVARGGHSFFCTINDGPFGTIWAVEMAILAFGTLACQGGICILFWKHRTAARLLGAPSSLDHFQLMRISIFNVWQVIGLMFDSRFTVTDFDSTLVCSTFLAILPLFVFIIFSSHKDILKYWCNSRKAETSKTIPLKPEDDLYLP
ncbi:hypothetical protein SISSUDRAFT_666715 [Sistotremastrum suecicum HHB10207 ss-3]|uniref:G-protein coupled receptors family 2 profile 2 domain-containing protein n=1 Tax=Sistotremastrum suecicum HHB10207 ss-3 TaxID=1314776 RepID=A0A166E447_9AGAM|nr:hypothetical protein SISSUDRAFT_666715 [Sistotremastrum suecicum HHB10207 ss-3]